MFIKPRKPARMGKNKQNLAYIVVSTPCECCGSPLKVNINDLLAKLKELKIPITAVCDTCGNEERITYADTKGA